MHDAMTQAELHYFERVPQLLAQLVTEIKNLAKGVDELREQIKDNK